jgi:glycine/D-amino acid oxidase-like deaminating enzyme
MLRANPTKSHWLKNIQFNEQYSRKVDIVVVGAGISGASLCYHLSELDPTKKVMLMDARGLAGGATGRNGGLLWPSMPDRWTSLVSRFGTETTQKLLSFSMENVNRIKDFVSRIPNDAEHHPRLTRFPGGAIHLMESAEDLNSWEYEIKQMKETGGCLDIDVWDKDFLQQKLRTQKEYQGAIHDREAYSIRPGALVYHLVKTAHLSFTKSNGSLYFLQQHVQNVHRQPDGFSISTKQGQVEANQIVYCTNAYANELVPEAKITPIRNQVIITKPLKKLPFDFAITCNSGYEYLSPREDNRIVLGGMRYLAPDADVNNSDDASLHPKVSQGLRNYLQTRFPGLENVEVEEEWAGIMGWTSDRLALVGPIPNRSNEFICAGFSGHGMPRAHLCALQVAKLLLSQPLDSSFPNVFLMDLDRTKAQNKFESKL